MTKGKLSVVQERRRAEGRSVRCTRAAWDGLPECVKIPESEGREQTSLNRLGKGDSAGAVRDGDTATTGQCSPAKVPDIFVTCAALRVRSIRSSPRPSLPQRPLVPTRPHGRRIRCGLICGRVPCRWVICASRGCIGGFRASSDVAGVPNTPPPGVRHWEVSRVRLVLYALRHPAFSRLCLLPGSFCVATNGEAAYG